MVQYINKSALVAEIKERIETYNKGYANGDDRRADALEILLHDLNTLEVKEVDLNKEFSQWWKSERAKDYNVDILYEKYPNVSMKLAKHFFELGLKAPEDIYK